MAEGRASPHTPRPCVARGVVDAEPPRSEFCALLLLEWDEPSVRWPEAASIEIERAEVRIEIDMKPLTAGFPRAFNRLFYQICRKALSPQRSRYHRVQNEGVNTSIPGDVNEPDQLR